MSGVERFDVAVIGSGPSGHEAALAAATAGRRTLLIESGRSVGGECVHRGTIPSKTLCETAGLFLRMRAAAAGVSDVPPPESIRVDALTSRVAEVVRGHVGMLERRHREAGVAHATARASFVGPRELELLAVDGSKRRVAADVIVIAVGSRPRTPDNVAVDHENVFDSDSFLAMEWLPRSLVVLGAGVIACEYASIFAALGVKVALVDKGARPMPFLDPELSDFFVKAFVATGGRFISGAQVVSSTWNGADAVETVLASGEVLRSDKALCALGRVANTRRLNLAAAGLAVNERGHLPVDARYETSVKGVYAVGDVIGPPALAGTSADQGRRAIRGALGLDLGAPIETVPVGTYTLPDLASVGLDEAAATKRFGGCVVGRATYAELARGLISSRGDGLIKLVAAPDGRKLLGAQIAGDSAIELIHLAQMALLANADVDVFVDHVFNFPTLAEGYRLAALDVVRRRAASTAALAPAS